MRAGVRPATPITRPSSTSTLLRQPQRFPTLLSEVESVVVGCLVPVSMPALILFNCDVASDLRVSRVSTNLAWSFFFISSPTSKRCSHPYPSEFATVMMHQLVLVLQYLQSLQARFAQLGPRCWSVSQGARSITPPPAASNSTGRQRSSSWTTSSDGGSWSDQRETAPRK